MIFLTTTLHKEREKTSKKMPSYTITTINTKQDAKFCDKTNPTQLCHCYEDKKRHVRHIVAVIFLPYIQFDRFLHTKILSELWMVNFKREMMIFRFPRGKKSNYITILCVHGSNTNFLLLEFLWKVELKDHEMLFIHLALVLDSS